MVKIRSGPATAAAILKHFRLPTMAPKEIQRAMCARGEARPQELIAFLEEKGLAATGEWGVKFRDLQPPDTETLVVLLHQRGGRHGYSIVMTVTPNTVGLLEATTGQIRQVTRKELDQEWCAAVGDIPYVRWALWVSH